MSTLEVHPIRQGIMRVLGRDGSDLDESPLRKKTFYVDNLKVSLVMPIIFDNKTEE
jgi:hypothetical protein